MAGDAVYRCSTPWDPGRPQATVIMCADGRWQRHVHEFVVSHLGHEAHPDFLAVPGGIEPLTLLDWVPKDFNFLKRRLQALIRAHGTNRIIAIAHQDCAWYAARRIGPVTLDLQGRQISDLKRAASILQEMFPGVAIETYYARLTGTSPEHVVFDPV